MPNIDLDKMEALARAATPGPWVDGGHTVYQADHVGADEICKRMSTEDSAYMAAANPVAVRALIALARRATHAGSAAPTDDQWIFDLAAEFETRGNGLYGPVTFSAQDLPNFVHAAVKRDAQPVEATGEQDAIAQEMKRLHDALCFWLPQSRAGLPDAMQERIAADAYLLVGYDDMPDKQSAEELGWIKVEAAGSAAKAEPSKITDLASARKFVDAWHLKHFPTDRTFTRYIMNDPARSNPLAGDFAWQLAHALEAMEAAQPAPACSAQAASADDIRSAGWAVAVHNDYRLNGEAHTFWLFTKDGRAAKGEGKTDAEALAQVRAEIGLAAPATAQVAQADKLLTTALRDLLTDAQAGVLDGDAVREAQKLLDLFDEDDGQVSRLEALSVIARFTKADHPYSSATAIERREARSQLDAIAARIGAIGAPTESAAAPADASKQALLFALELAEHEDDDAAMSFLKAWNSEDVSYLRSNWPDFLAAHQPTSTAARDVLAERRRQVEQEGWNTNHDDGHDNGEMARAGGLYALYAHEPLKLMKQYAPPQWPWDERWWKPDTARRNLVKAGALIIAEIERLDRASQQPTPTGEKA